jgi:glutamate racemase
MKVRVRIGLVLALAGFVFAACAKKPAMSRKEMIEDFLANEQDVTILVTDSGLGGLSVAADLAARLPESGIFRRARIVFYNSLFHSNGYNSLESGEEKARIFNTVLKAMTKKYRPDILLIACNTLSVVYETTAFADKAPFPVIGIVEEGADLITRQFKKTPEATIVIFGTRTTIESEAHKKILVARGFPEEQIVGQACHRLAGAIERGTDTEETVGYIRQFVAEAVDKLGDFDGPVFGSFNCTHFGYTRDQFAEAFAAAGYPEISFLDPNPLMADFMFKPEYLNRFPGTEVGFEVVSLLEISEQKRNAIGPLLEKVSPAAAEALRNYRLDPKLFKVDYTPPPKKDGAA